MDNKLKSVILDSLKKTVILNKNPSIKEFTNQLINNGLDEQQIKVAINKCIVTNVCRHCNKIIGDDIDVWTTYWWNFWVPCHKNCKINGMKEEAYECQLIDSDCNDCLYFDRVKGNNGNCKKFNIETIANPVFCTGKVCFKHRKN